MGSPPELYRSRVEPFTTRAESTPLLSQSMKPTPPLIDSTIYFFSGEAMCETERPAEAVISSKTGTAGADRGPWAFPMNAKIAIPDNVEAIHREGGTLVRRRFGKGNCLYREGGGLSMGPREPPIRSHNGRASPRAVV